MRYLLENDILSVEIDSFGAEVKSVKSKKDNKEYMWNADKKYWGRTSPVLFPFVGSCRNKEYSYQGITYKMMQHGFARDLEHTLLSKTGDSIWFCLKATPATKQIYPFDFVLKIGYELKDNALKVMWKVENPSSDKNLYFSIGAHPAFCCNFTEDEYRIGFSKNGFALESIAYHGINEENGLSITEDLSLKLKDGAVSVSKDFFDRCALIFEGCQADEVSLISKDGNAFVSVSFDMPLFALWSPEGKSAPFICIEPWCGRCDHEDFRGTLEEREYSNSLSAGGYFESGYTVRFN